jgi:hypothetical protein
MAATCPYLHDLTTQQHLDQKINRLLGQARWHGHDRDDLQQHLSWAIQRAWLKYDPSRQSWYPFLRMILSREAASLLRGWHAAKRRGLELSGACWASLEESGRIRHPPRRSLEERERCQLRLDVIKVVARLPYRLREVAEQLPDHTISSLSRHLELDRNTIRLRIRQLRRLFEKACLHDY